MNKLIVVCLLSTMVAVFAQQQTTPATQLTGGCAANPCDGAASGPSVDSAVSPVADWIKDFKGRSGAGNGDLFSSARETVRPLLRQLRKNQKKTLQKLKDSNEKIVTHVDEEATEHMYNVLKAQKNEEQKEKSAMKKVVKAKKLEAKAQADASAAAAAEKSAEKALKKVGNATNINPGQALGDIKKAISL